MAKLSLLIAIVLLSACLAEGEPKYSSQGDKKYFLSMDACDFEARSEYKPGSPKYTHYTCRKKLLGFKVLEEKHYED